MATAQVKTQAKIHKKGINIDSYFGELISPYLVRRFRKYIDFPVLDAGSGDGSMILELRRTFPKKEQEIRGIDLAPIPQLHIEEGNLADMPYDKNTFSTIFCTEVLEHLDDTTLRGTLQEMQRVLKPGGTAIITFPFQEDLSKSTFTCPQCDHTFHYVGHIRTFDSRKQIERMFTENHFLVRHIDILPLGAVAKIPALRLVAPLLNKLHNPPGFRKRAIVLLSLLS